MKKNKIVDVKAAAYIEGYRLSILFVDGKEQLVDFADFVFTNKWDYLDKYIDIENFKKFRIESGNIVWGENLDMIFPVHELYRGKINVARWWNPFQHKVDKANHIIKVSLPPPYPQFSIRILKCYRCEDPIELKTPHSRRYTDVANLERQFVCKKCTEGYYFKNAETEKLFRFTDAQGRNLSKRFYGRKRNRPLVDDDAGLASFTIPSSTTKSKKIEIIVDKTDTGLSAYSGKYSVYTTGITWRELKSNMLEALNLHFEGKAKVITENDLKIIIDLQQFTELLNADNPIDAIQSDGILVVPITM